MRFTANNLHQAEYFTLVTDVATLKPKILLSLAILRELYNKVNYYRTVVDRNMRQYKEYIDKMSRIAPEKINDIEKELSLLKSIDEHLNSISLFLEGVTLRLETLIVSGNIMVAAIVLKDIIKVLKQNIRGVPPILSVLIDKLDELSRDIVSELQNNNSMKGLIPNVSAEAIKIVDEVKKSSGLR